jgi:hypothetical protein
MLPFESVRARNRSCLPIYTRPSLSLVERRYIIANWGRESVLCMEAAASAASADVHEFCRSKRVYREAISFNLTAEKRSHVRGDW